MKYLIYCRKSTDTEDRQVLSLDSQESELLQLAKTHNLEVSEIFRESMSAKAEGRPVFGKVLETIKKGKADGIICWKLDRLARNMMDGGQIMDLLQKGIIKEIHTYEGIHLPTDNVLLLAVNFGMANQYIRDLSSNVKRGNRAKLEKGGWTCRAPFGYVNDNKEIKGDKRKSLFVSQIFSLYSKRNTLKQISQILLEKGLKMGKGQIYRILNNKFYIGLMERDGKIYNGNHKPLVSLSLFNEVQDILNEKYHPRIKKHFYSARGFLTCASCGCALTADTKKGYQYYYCTNGKGGCAEHKKYLRSEKIDGLLSQMFLILQFDEEFIEISGEAYKQRNERKTANVEPTLEILSKELKSLLDKELALTDGLASKMVRKEIYEIKMLEIANDRVLLEKQVEETKKKAGQPSATFEQIKNVFLDGNKASKRYLAVQDDEKRKMLEKLLSNATIQSQNILDYQFKSPYQALADSPKNMDLETMCG